LKVSQTFVRLVSQNGRYKTSGHTPSKVETQVLQPTDTTLTHPHQISNTQRTKNKRPLW